MTQQVCTLVLRTVLWRDGFDLFFLFDLHAPADLSLPRRCFGRSDGGLFDIGLKRGRLCYHYHAAACRGFLAPRRSVVSTFWQSACLDHEKPSALARAAIERQVVEP